MTAANERQEGGDHYQRQGKIQHWDLAVMYQWDPFQYQITKYVMRWKDKHPTHEQRLVDLKKARHFLDKYIEEAEKYDPRATPLQFPDFSPSSLALLDNAGQMAPMQAAMSIVKTLEPSQRVVALTQEAAKLAAGDLEPERHLSPEYIQGLDQSSTLEYQNEGYYGDGKALFKCLRCRATFTALTTAAAAASHGPTCPAKQTV